MKRLSLCLILICLLLGCSSHTEKNIVSLPFSSPQFTLQSITEASEYIVIGKVTATGEMFTVTSETNTGRTYDIPLTPHTIEVTDCLKGEINGNTIVYNERGGEDETTIYEYDDGNPKVSVGDEVLLFLNDVNAAWGAQGVYIIEDDTIDVYNHMFDAEMYDLSGETKTGIALGDFAYLIEQALSEAVE